MDLRERCRLARLIELMVNVLRTLFRLYDVPDGLRGHAAKCFRQMASERLKDPEFFLREDAENTLKGLSWDLKDWRRLQRKKD